VVGGLYRVAASVSVLFSSDPHREHNLRSGSLVFPTPSSAFPVTRLALEGFRRLRHALFSFAPLQSTSPCAPVGSPDLLSWDSSRGCAISPTLLPEHGVSIGPSPLHRLLPGVHSRDDVAIAASGSEDLSEHRVPTSWFRTTAPVFSAVRPIAGTAVPIAFATSPGVAGLLHPAADRGVRRVSARCDVWFDHLSPFPEIGVRTTTSTASPRRYLPLEELPPPAAVPCHHGRCPLDVFLGPAPHTSARPLPVCLSCAIDMRRRLQGFDPLVGPYHRAPYSSTRWPVLPGLCSPPRSFDRCATEAASRRMATRSAGGDIQSEHNPCAPLPALVEEPHRSVDSESTALFRTLQTTSPWHEAVAEFPVSREPSRSPGRCPPPRGQTFAPWPRLVRSERTGLSRRRMASRSVSLFHFTHLRGWA